MRSHSHPSSSHGAPASRGSLRARLGCAELHDTRRAWAGAGVLLLFALVMRLWGLGAIDALIFDETYYVKDGWTLVTHGVEMEWPDEPDPDPAFAEGRTDGYLDRGAYVVHPPVGKVLIGLPMLLLGAGDPVAWRLAVAVLGSVSVAMMALIGRRLLRSTEAGWLAGLLLAVDGQHLVASRVSLLDLPLMVLVLGAFGALLIDRDGQRECLAAWHDSERARDAAGQVRPAPRRVRWWRIAAGALLGLACGVKWSGLYFLAVFGIVTVLWDWWARRRAGERGWLQAGLLRDAIPAFFAMVGTALAVYLTSWSGWFASREGYFRQWAAEQGIGGGPAVRALVSLWHYHRDAYAFHVGLDADHTYASNPLTWLVQWRPVNYYYESLSYGQSGCEVQECSSQVLALGNPLLWWSAAVAVVIMLVRGVLWRDGAAWAALAGIAAGYLPWLMYMDRTVFTFYTVVFLPWMVLCLTHGLQVLAGGAGTGVVDRERRMVGVAAAGSLVVLILLVSAFFWPIWSGEVIELRQWGWRMWMPSWR